MAMENGDTSHAGTAIGGDVAGARETVSPFHRADQLLGAITSKNAVTFQENVHEAW